jgi:hypothetical protein
MKKRCRVSGMLSAKEDDTTVTLVVKSVFYGRNNVGARWVAEDIPQTFLEMKRFK